MEQGGGQRFKVAFTYFSVAKRHYNKQKNPKPNAYAEIVYLIFVSHTWGDVFIVLANLAGCLCLQLLHPPAAQHWLQKSLPSMGQSRTMDQGTENPSLCAGLAVLLQVDSCKCSNDSDDIWVWRHAVLGLRFCNSGAVVDNWTFATISHFYSRLSRFLSIILLSWQQKRFVELPGTKSSAQHGRILDIIQGHFASDGL